MQTSVDNFLGWVVIILAPFIFLWKMFPSLDGDIVQFFRGVKYTTIKLYPILSTFKIEFEISATLWIGLFISPFILYKMLNNLDYERIKLAIAVTAILFVFPVGWLLHTLPSDDRYWGFWAWAMWIVSIFILPTLGQLSVWYVVFWIIDLLFRFIMAAFSFISSCWRDIVYITGWISSRFSAEAREDWEYERKYTRQHEDAQAGGNQNNGFDSSRFNGSARADTPYGVDKRDPRDAPLWAVVDDPNAPPPERQACFSKVLKRQQERELNDFRHASVTASIRSNKPDTQVNEVVPYTAKRPVGSV